MNKLFNYLSVPVSNNAKLNLIEENISDFLKDKTCLIDSEDHLLKICSKLEDKFESLLHKDKQSNIVEPSWNIKQRNQLKLITLRYRHVLKMLTNLFQVKDRVVLINIKIRYNSDKYKRSDNKKVNSFLMSLMKYCQNSSSSFFQIKNDLNKLRL